MKRFSKTLLLASAACIFAVPAFAPVAFSQGNTITIIRDDGTKDVIELERPETVSEPAARTESVVRRAPKIEIETDPAPVIPRAERVAEPVSKPKPPAELASPPKMEVKPAFEAAPKPPSTTAEKTLDIVKPSRKPHRQILPAGEPITKDRALYIALGEAPPARDVQVFPIEDEQGLMYSVVFKTEDSGYEVLVDGASGVIMRSGAIENGQAFVKPGHLPVR